MTDDFSQEEIFRYSRHLLVPEVGLEGQRKLKAASVLVIGAGGLGSPVALYLAAAGVGHIGLVDDDMVDVSNLQRQILHDTHYVGQPKAESGRHRLLALNPRIRVDAIQDSFNESTAMEIAAGYDILVDCSDNFATRYLINDLCVLTQRPDVYGAIYRFEGQVSVLDARHGPCYRCLFPEPPSAEISPSCSETGVLGTVPAVIGSLQAAEVIKLVLGIGSPLIGQLLIYEALEASFQKIKLAKRPDCAVCGQTPTVITLSDSRRFCSDEEILPLAADEKISPSELATQLRGPHPPLLIDVRSPVEQQVSFIEGALSFPLDQLEAHLAELEKHRETVVFCRTGRRSSYALRLLREAGFDHVRNLVGGINAWAREVAPQNYQY